MIFENRPFIRELFLLLKSLGFLIRGISKMPAGRPKGAKNRRPVGEEYVKKAAQHRASARLARVVPYDLDENEKLDPMALLEEVMQHFYRKAKIEESLGRFCDFRLWTMPCRMQPGLRAN